MTRARLMQELSNTEFVHWQMYYSKIAQDQELAAKG